MTAQILNTELSNLIQESKRKNSELRNAAEKSLEELKALRSTSEAQIAADLSNRPNFVTPFLIACATKNAKFLAIAIVCLQRLISSRALPSSRLREVLDALRDSSAQGLDVQLKILQSLPALLSNYELRDELLATALNVCTLLQANKNGIVNNTAAATLQQLVVTVFDKVVAEDKLALEVPTIASVTGENGQIQVRAAAFDAYRVFNDLCLLTESQKPKFLKTSGLPQTFGLELIESVLTNHSDLFLEHPEQGFILRSRVMPFVVSSLSEKLNFPTTVRIVRILYTLLRRHLSILGTEAEMALGLLTQMLDADTASWKRALCMEVFRGLFAEPGLVRQMYALYDAQDGRKDVLSDIIATFVRLSSEKPALIGLSTQSTLPATGRYTTNSQQSDQAVLESSGIPGIIGTQLATSEANVGISSQWSSMRVPCIDQLDKQDPPTIPDTYIYSLGLTCINGFSEGLAQFILPLTVPKRAKGTERGPSFKKNPIPLNPLELDDHALYVDIRTCAGIVESCWPALLATCSTFLHAALDGDYYHGLVRSFQKFAHVAGLLRLSTPRDAFLTTLSKASVPPSIFSTTAMSSGPASPTNEQPQSILGNTRGLLTVDGNSNAASGAERSRQASSSENASTLNTRNMLCLRALLNLGIALGPTLDVAWLIILECLQRADLMLFTSARGTGKIPSSPIRSDSNAVNNNALLANLGTEIKAVETAAQRLFESTIDFPEESFLDVIDALCKLFGKSEQNQEDFFALAKLGDVASINIERLRDPEASGWALLTDQLIKAGIDGELDPPVRIRATEGLVKLILEVAETITSEGSTLNEREAMQSRLLATLNRAIEPLQGQKTISVASQATDVEVHKIVLEGLRSLLEHCGELLTMGWDIVFVIIGSVFTTKARSSKLIKSSFGSLQLVCSDFLSVVPKSCFLTLVDMLYEFCTQDADLNICLTTVTFFWVLSDHISSQGEAFDLSSDLLAAANEAEYKTKAKSSSSATSSGALWMLLLLRLTVVTMDDRLELRNSAIQTLLSIFDANGDSLSPEAWSTCLDIVIFKMFRSMEDKLKVLGPAADKSLDAGRNAWVDTTVVVLNGVANLLTTYLHVLTNHKSFLSCWRNLLKHFDTLLEIDSLVINTAVFKALKDILSRANTDAENSATLDEPAQSLAWDLWSQGLPLPDAGDGSDPKTTNQACLTAYVSSLPEIYRLIKANVALDQTKRILQLLRETIERATAEAYSADVEYLTALQTQVLESLKLIRTDIQGVPSAMIAQAAELVDLAFRASPNQDNSNRRTPTYVALSKAAMSLADTLISANAEDVDIYRSSALTSALQALARPITLKYSFATRTKSISPWRLATTTAISILRSVLPHTSKASLPTSDTHAVWDVIVSIASGIISASPPASLSTIEVNVDQDFDISAFLEIRDLITSGLDSQIVPNSARGQYTEALFHTSFIHAPLKSDLPQPGEGLEACLQKTRRPRTIDPPPSKRKKMSYVCLAELFTLAGSAITDGNEESRLAQAAAPCLLIRCSITLKGYAADQPLRGLCPPPLSQKQELIFILERLVGQKRHVLALYPLLVSSIRVEKGLGADDVQNRVKGALLSLSGSLNN